MFSWLKKRAPPVINPLKPQQIAANVPGAYRITNYSTNGEPWIPPPRPPPPENATAVMRNNYFEPNTVRQDKWAIMLDFDKTIAGGHSGGVRFTDDSPMDETNKVFFIEHMRSWLSQGHSVAILTRAVSENIVPYLTEALSVIGVRVIVNNFESGALSVYAPNKTDFDHYHEPNMRESSAAEHWAMEKVNYAVDFLNKCRCGNALFLDDTVLNVERMQLWLPTKIVLTKSVIEPATPGDYQSTFARVNKIIGMTGGGRRNVRRQRKSRRNVRRQRKSRRNVRGGI